MVTKVSFSAPAVRPTPTESKALANVLASGSDAKSSQAANRGRPPETARRSTIATAAQTRKPTLEEAEARLKAYAVQYAKKADGKAGVQKAMDAVRMNFNEGYRDDQFKNIGQCRQQLAALRNSSMTPAQADEAAASIMKKFDVEEARVTKAQAGNAEVGKAVHGAGRVGVVVVSGVAATATAGPLAGMAAASAAGSLYDAATALDQGKSDIAPKLDAGQSLGGVVARGLKGEKIGAGDWVRGGFGTVTDGANGAFAGQGMLSARAAQSTAQLVAAQSGRDASRRALAYAAAKANVLTTSAQTGANYALKSTSIAVDPSLTQRQKTATFNQNNMQTATQLPGQLLFGAASSGAGASLPQLRKKAANIVLQYGVDGATNVAQTSANNTLAGKGPGLSKADIAAAAVQSGTGAIQNMAQRVPRKTSQQVVEQSGTMHPYAGTAVSSIPAHKGGKTVVVGPLQKMDFDTRSKTVLQGDDGQSMPHTKEMWHGNTRSTIEAATNRSPSTAGTAHTYRTFEHPLTKKRMALKVDLGRPNVMGRQDQSAMDRLTQRAGMSTKTAVVSLTDETPANVLPQTPADKRALLILKAASTGAQTVGAMSRLGSDNPRPGTLRNQTRVLGVPGEWMRHFLEGSGKPKAMSEAQVEKALTGTRVEEQEQFDARRVLQAQIDASRARGQTSGEVEVFSKDKPIATSAVDGWYNALGSAHVSAVYKGKWKVNSSDGSVRFQGEQRWLVQDRYNWQVPEFNGSMTTSTTPIPAQVVKLLPQSYQEAFKPVNRQKGERVTDTILGHLQMVKGGAQPFWTFGLGAPKPVKLEWTPGADSGSNR